MLRLTKKHLLAQLYLNLFFFLVFKKYVTDGPLIRYTCVQANSVFGVISLQKGH